MLRWLTVGLILIAAVLATLRLTATPGLSMQSTGQRITLADGSTISGTTSSVQWVRIATARATGSSSVLTVRGLNGNTDGEYQIKMYVATSASRLQNFSLCFPDISGSAVISQEWWDIFGATGVGGSGGGGGSAGSNTSHCATLGESHSANSRTNRSQCTEDMTAAAGEPRLVSGMCWDADIASVNGPHLQLNGAQLGDIRTELTQLQLSTGGANFTADTYMEVWAPRTVTTIVP